MQENLTSSKAINAARVKPNWENVLSIKDIIICYQTSN